MNQSKGLLGYGGALVDLLARVDDAFLSRIGGGKGGARELSSSSMDSLRNSLPERPERRPGGATANTLRLYAQLGGACGFLGVAGTDDDGDFFRKSLADAGVGTGLFRQLPGERTGCCLVLVTPDGERTMRTFQGAAAAFRAEECDVAELSRHSRLLVEGYAMYFPESLAGLCRRAKQAGLEMVFDLQARELVEANRDWLRGFLRGHVSLVLANEQECAAMSPSGALADGEAELRRLCPGVVVKLGARGARVWLDGRETVVPAIPARAVDTTGAGDAWTAGFLHGLDCGWTTGRAGRLGARLASAVVETNGAVLPTALVRKLLETEKES